MCRPPRRCLRPIRAWTGCRTRRCAPTWCSSRRLMAAPCSPPAPSPGPAASPTTAMTTTSRGSPETCCAGFSIQSRCERWGRGPCPDNAADSFQASAVVEVRLSLVGCVRSLVMGNAVSREPARDPQDLERLLVTRQRAGDVEGMVALYEREAVVDVGDGWLLNGIEAIRAYFADV